MKKYLFFLLILSALIFSFCTTSGKAVADREPCKETDYLFFLHNRFLEENDEQAEHPQYGRAEYSAILDSFRKRNFNVISEKRVSGTDAKLYARKVVRQIDSLLKAGATANHITVVGTSKGGYIAQYVSTYLANPEVNYVLIGCFQELDTSDYPDIQLCGNILSIYEKTDASGVSGIYTKNASGLTIPRFKEIALNTGLKHGFLFKPMNEWIIPAAIWGKRNYELENK